MRKLAYLVIAILILVTCTVPVVAEPVFSCSDVTEIPQIECEALVALYNSTNGSGWTQNTNWLMTNKPSDWYGVNVIGGHVVYLYFNNNLLSGSIPPELGNLTSLQSLALDYNQLSGSIPPELGNLTSLVGLGLEGNQLSGNIPPELANLSSLVGLSIKGNQLSGNIPPELGNLAHAVSLFLNDNQLIGSIPPELGHLTILQWLGLSGNQLTGNIPPEFGNLAGLLGMDLSPNHLSGNIPPELGNLSYLLSLYLTDNQLSGSIPPELGKLHLSELYLSGNQLTGNIPPELGNLTILNALDLSDNQLIGSIPPGLGNLNKMWILRLSGNQLSGSIPESFINLVELCDAAECGKGGLDLDYNLFNVPPGYPDPAVPLQVFLHQKDPDWQLFQGFKKVISIEGGEFTSLDGKTNFFIPAGSLDRNTTFTFMPQQTPQHFSDLLAFAHNSFQLTAVDSGGNSVTTFNLPVTVTLTYSDNDRSGIPEASLGLYYWDQPGSAWKDAVTTCLGGEYMREPAANKFSLLLCHLTEFGVFGPTLRIFMPNISH